MKKDCNKVTTEPTVVVHACNARFPVENISISVETVTSFYLTQERYNYVVTGCRNNVENVKKH